MSTLHERFMKLQKQRHEFDVTDINGRVLIVDGLNMYIRCFAATPTMNDDGDHVGGMAGFLKSLGVSIRTFKPTRAIIIFDGRGGSLRRRKIFPEYKENRKTMTRLNRTYNFTDKEHESKSLSYQLIELAHLLKCLPVTVLAPPHVEADDVIAYLSYMIADRGGTSIIVSTDKDFLQVISDKTSVWNPIKKKVYEVDSVIKEYGIHPNNFAIFRSLDGDKSDNIPGIKGIGRKTLLKHFPQLSESTVMNVQNIIDYSQKQTTGKIFEHIINGQDIITRNYQLMQLEDSLISTQNKIEIMTHIDSHKVQLEKAQLTKALIESKMLSIFKNYDTWLQTTFAPLLRYSLTK